MLQINAKQIYIMEDSRAINKRSDSTNHKGSNTNLRRTEVISSTYGQQRQTFQAARSPVKRVTVTLNTPNQQTRSSSQQSRVMLYSEYYPQGGENQTPVESEWKLQLQPSRMLHSFLGLDLLKKNIQVSKMLDCINLSLSKMLDNKSPQKSRISQFLGNTAKRADQQKSSVNQQMIEDEYFDRMRSPSSQSNQRRQGSTPNKAMYLRTAGGYQVLSPENKERGPSMFSPAGRKTICASPKQVMNPEIPQHQTVLSLRTPMRSQLSPERSGGSLPFECVPQMSLSSLKKEIRSVEDLTKPSQDSSGSQTTSAETQNHLTRLFKDLLLSSDGTEKLMPKISEQEKKVFAEIEKREGLLVKERMERQEKQIRLMEIEEENRKLRESKRERKINRKCASLPYSA